MAISDRIVLAYPCYSSIVWMSVTAVALPPMAACLRCSSFSKHCNLRWQLPGRRCGEGCCRRHIWLYASRHVLYMLYLLYASHSVDRVSCVSPHCCAVLCPIDIVRLFSYLLSCTHVRICARAESCRYTDILIYRYPRICIICEYSLLYICMYVPVHGSPNQN